MSAQAPSSIRRIGYFHFVADRWRDPLGSLERELKELKSIRDALIVLPEFFNCGDQCNPGEKPAIGASTCRSSLAGLSRKYGVVFVAALVDESTRFNSAWLIDADIKCDPWRWLCHKNRDDHPDTQLRLKLYQPSPDDPINQSNPCYWKGVHIGALICNDAVDGMDFTRMLVRLSENSGRGVVCVPARMGSQSFGNDPISGPCEPGSYCVLANSDPQGCRSFIASARGIKVHQSDQSVRNDLALLTWQDLEAVDAAPRA